MPVGRTTAGGRDATGLPVSKSSVSSTRDADFFSQRRDSPTTTRGRHAHRTQLPGRRRRTGCCAGPGGSRRVSSSPKVHRPLPKRSATPGSIPGMVRELYLTADAAASTSTWCGRPTRPASRSASSRPRAAELLSDTQAPQGLVARCALPRSGRCRRRSGRRRRWWRCWSTPTIRATPAPWCGWPMRPAPTPWCSPATPSTRSTRRRPRLGGVDLPSTGGPRGRHRRAAGRPRGSRSVGAGHDRAAELDLDQAGRDGLLDLPTAWLFGSEAHGLPTEVIEQSDSAIRVPIHGRAESLNLATAAAVCLYASASAQRRRNSRPVSGRASR